MFVSFICNVQEWNNSQGILLLRIFWEEMKTEAKLIFNLSEVAFYSTWVCATLLHSCLTLYNRMDHGPPGSSVHGDSPGKNTRVGCYALLQGIFPTQGWKLWPFGLLHRQAGSLPLAPPGKPVSRWEKYIKYIFIVIVSHLSQSRNPGS